MGHIPFSDDIMNRLYARTFAAMVSVFIDYGKWFIFNVCCGELRKNLGKGIITERMDEL
jgi:hypothetical protein